MSLPTCRLDPLDAVVRCHSCGWQGQRKDVPPRNGRAQDCPQCKRKSLDKVTK